MMRMKIAIVTPYGAEPRLDNYAEFLLAQAFIKAGHAVHFYTYRLKNNPSYQTGSYKGVPVIRCRQRLGIAPGLFFSILKFRPDAVMFFHPRSLLSFSAYCAARAAGAKTISEIVGILHDPYMVDDRDDPITTLKKDAKLITSWGGFLKSVFSGRLIWNWKNFLYHMPVAKADRIVAINKDEQNYIKKFYGRDSEVIYWAIPKNYNRTQAKPAANLPEKFLLLVAQVKKRKGWDTAIEAVGLLARQGVHKNLVFVCPRADVSEALSYAEKLGIAGQVYFLSAVSNEEKNWLYVQAEAVLVPSRYEGFGLPVFEAFIWGKPVLGTDIPVFLEFLEHGRNALISKTGDPVSLAENIKALNADPTLAAKIVEAGYKTAEQFSDEVMVKKFLDLIQALIRV